MRRRLRWALNSAVAVSAVLFLANCALWACSYRQAGFIERSLSSSVSTTALQENWRLLWRDGRFHLRSQRRFERYNDPNAFPTWTGARWSWGPYEVPQLRFPVDAFPESEQSIWERLGFDHYALERAVPLEDWRMTGLAVPAWLLAVAFAALPACYVIRFGCSRVRRRRLPGLCAGCGYDLRATPDRCPECGAVPTAVK